MVSGSRKRWVPAQERWFWIGVGFVSALAVMLIGLFFVVSLTARDESRPIARQAAPPTPGLESAPVELPSPGGFSHPMELPPPPAVDPNVGRPPQPAPTPSPNRPSVNASQAPPIAARPPRAPAPKSPTAPVRVVERQRPPDEASGLEAGLDPNASPTKSAPAPSARSKPASPRLAGGAPGAARAGDARPERAGPFPSSQHRSTAVTDPGNRRTITAEGGRGDAPPRLLAARDAEYPLGAIRDGVTGTTEIQVTIDPEGYVDRAVVARSSGDARLDAAAVRAVMAWRYRPALRGGLPVRGTDLATIEFFRDRGR